MGRGVPMSSAHVFAASATPKTSRASTLLPRFAWIVLGYNVAVVLWGAVVRATSSGGEAFHRRNVRFTQLPRAITGLVAILLVGMSGTLAALSDTLFPATSVRAALAQDFSRGSTWLQQLRFLHPVTAVIAGLFICWLLLRSIPRPEERKLAIGVLSLLVLQCVLGVADVVLLAPLWLQITHLFVADLLWIALVVLAARICVVPRMQPGG